MEINQFLQMAAPLECLGLLSLLQNWVVAAVAASFLLVAHVVNLVDAVAYQLEMASEYYQFVCC